MVTLYIFSGLPGVGKSTLALLLCKYVGATYLRVDAIEQALKSLFKADIYAEGYQLAYQLALDNLAQGLSVVGDSCNSVPESRREWEQTALKAQVRYINIEICCSDLMEHQSRVENRVSTIEGLTLPTWENVQDREYYPWERDVISIDTARKTPEQSFKELLKKLNL